MITRIILLVLDSVGIGELPDAEKYGDKGSNTLKNIAEAVGGIDLPNLGRLGLGKIEKIKGITPEKKPLACFGKMMERSAGKDTTTGHWEIAGIISEKPFPTYPKGFPDDLIAEFENQIGMRVLGNKAASGTEIIEELGPLHIETGFPIVYTSADSVFQIAAHEDVIPVAKLYEICEIARKLLKGPHAVGRVIARPFIGKPGAFKRTDRRRDFSLSPPEPTVLDMAFKKNLEVVGIGKIQDIFNGQGISKTIHTHNNMDGIDKTISEIERDFKGIIFTNLVDFDMLYGHRNDTVGYAKALEEFDKRLPETLKKMKPYDLFIITADHGCDPTTSSTDHSREYTPLLVYNLNMEAGINLGTRESFADVAATIADFLHLGTVPTGKSFKKEVLKSFRK